MNFSRAILLFAMCFTLAWSTGSNARENPSSAIKGTWYSDNGSITFKNNGTVNYKGKRYYYAVSSGGFIQLEGKKRSSRALPYQLKGDKLILTEDGKSIAYRRRK
jgi:hypothetical protein